MSEVKSRLRSWLAKANLTRHQLVQLSQCTMQAIDAKSVRSTFVAPLHRPNAVGLHGTIADLQRTYEQQAIQVQDDWGGLTSLAVRDSQM